MMTELFLCAFCFFIGAISRLSFVGVTVAERHIRLWLGVFALDFLWGALTVAALFAVIFLLNSGVTMPYMLIAALLGFAVTAVIV